LFLLLKGAGIRFFRFLERGCGKGRGLLSWGSLLSFLFLLDLLEFDVLLLLIANFFQEVH